MTKNSKARRKKRRRLEAAAASKETAPLAPTAADDVLPLASSKKHKKKKKRPREALLPGADAVNPASDTTQGASSAVQDGTDNQSDTGNRFDVLAASPDEDLGVEIAAPPKKRQVVALSSTVDTAAVERRAAAILGKHSITSAAATPEQATLDHVYGENAEPEIVWRNAMAAASGGGPAAHGVRGRPTPQQQLSIEQVRDLVLGFFGRGPLRGGAFVLRNVPLVPTVCVLQLSGLDYALWERVGRHSMPFLREQMSTCRTRAPGTEQRVHSALRALLYTKRESKSDPRSAPPAKRKRRGATIEELLLTYDDLVLHKYPVPPVAATAVSSSLVDDDGVPVAVDGDDDDGALDVDADDVAVDDAVAEALRAREEDVAKYARLSEYPYSGASASPAADKLHIVALDCEMVQTTGGPALARVAVVNYDGAVVYDRFVRPEARITDYLTQWSGITPELMADERCVSLQQVHNDLLGAVLHRDVVLCGHSLENDLHALRIVHTNVADTAVLYPRSLTDSRAKHALRFLASRYLKRAIQQKAPAGGAKGHDPREDAMAALDLLKLKIARGKDFGLPSADDVSIFSLLSTEDKFGVTVVDRVSIVNQHVPDDSSCSKVPVADDDEMTQKVLQAAKCRCAPPEQQAEAAAASASYHHAASGGGKTLVFGHFFGLRSFMAEHYVPSVSELERRLSLEHGAGVAATSGPQHGVRSHAFPIGLHELYTDMEAADGGGSAQKRDEASALLARIDAEIARVHASLCKGSVLIVPTLHGHFNLYERYMKARAAMCERNCWESAHQEVLERVVNFTREGLMFMTVK